MKAKTAYKSFIFTHIPKCGGTSFREYIHQVGLANGIPQDKIHVPGAGTIANNKNISQLTKIEFKEYRASRKLILADHSKFNVHKEYKLNMEAPYYYVIFREPVERFVSHYNFFYRHLDYWGLKDVHLNDLKKETLIELLSRFSNLQLFYCMNAKYLFVDLAPPLEKMKMFGRQLIRTITFDKYCKVVPWGLKADDAWLREGLANIRDSYGSFGILENMELSLNLLKATSPEWLSFSQLDLPVKNKRIEFENDEPICEETLGIIRRYNYYDLKFYDEAMRIFESKCREFL